MDNSVTPRWLCMSAACTYASMGLKKMKRHIKAGEILAKKSGKWFVDRYSIDEFFGDKKNEEIAVEKILASFR
jgi:hypothetical protein